MPTSRADFVDFNQVKKSVSILQILEHYNLTEKLKRNGDSFSGSCPIHNGDNLTQFRVSISKNCWNCFGKCKGGGNILDFVSKKENVNIRQAALLIQTWFGLQPQKPEQKNGNGKPAPEKPELKVDKPPTEPEEELTENKPLGFSLQNLDPTHPYLIERGLTKETIAEFGLGYCSKGILVDRIAIPIHNCDGKVVGYVGRWPGDPPDGKPKYQLPKGFKKSLEVFNLHRAAKESGFKPLIVVEGFFDCMKVWQSGYKRVVALMGSSLSETQEALLVQEAGKTLLMLDADDAGQIGNNQAAIRLGRHGFVRIVSIPSPATQPDSLDEQELRDLLTEVL